MKMPGVGGWASTGTVCSSEAGLLIQIKGTAEVKKGGRQRASKRPQESNERYDDAEPFRRLPWQAESPSAVRLKRITMIRIFRLHSRSEVLLQRKKSAASRGRYLGVCLSNYPLSGEDSAELRPDHDACSFFGSPDGPAARLLK
jgi:hypothetical protein